MKEIKHNVVDSDEDIFITSYDFQNFLGTACPTIEAMDEYHKMLGSKNISFKFGILNDYYDNYDEDEIMSFCNNITSSFDFTICSKYDLIFDFAAINVAHNRIQVYISTHTDKAVKKKKLKGIIKDFHMGDYKRFMRDVHGIDIVYY